MPQDLKALLKDRRFQLAAAGAGGLGLLVLYVRGRGSASSTETPSGQTLQPATFDSSGTDLYNAIQSIGQQWTSQLGQVSDQLGTVIDKLDNTPPGTITPSTLPAVKPAPPAVGKPPQRVKAGTTVSVPLGVDLYGWSQKLSQTVPGFTYQKLISLNPGIKQYITWKDNGPGRPRTPVFRTSGGVPKVRVA